MTYVFYCWGLKELQEKWHRDILCSARAHLTSGPTSRWMMAWPEWSGTNAGLCCSSGVTVNPCVVICVISEAELDARYFSLSHWFHDAVDWWLVKLACWESNKCIKSSHCDVYCAESCGSDTLETQMTCAEVMLADQKRYKRGTASCMQRLPQFWWDTRCTWSLRATTGH